MDQRNFRKVKTTDIVKRLSFAPELSSKLISKIEKPVRTASLNDASFCSSRFGRPQVTSNV